MSRRIEMQMFGRTQSAMVELDEGDVSTCAHCLFVRNNVDVHSNPGALVFVHRADDPIGSLRRIEIVCTVEGKGVLLACCQVTPEQALAELEALR